MLKCELKRFGLKNNNDFQRDILSKSDYKIVREFVKNDEITVRKADKNNTFVIMNTSDYRNKLNAIVNQGNKFKRIDKDPTENLKKKLNSFITAANNYTNEIEIPKLSGHYSPGYLYGNPKIHKDVSDPPLRPIISQIGTPSYEVAKILNSMLVKYLPEKYSIKSTDEFINIIRNSKSCGTLASLDVENLFTNVPVKETIDIILRYSHQNLDLKPPPIDEHLLRELLLACTTETPFQHPNGNIYLQTDGVSMGSPLGPLFANFYMCHIENNILSQYPSEFKPSIYCRYVDDIFVQIKNLAHMKNLQSTFESQSKLKFTFEIERQRQLNFLDVNITPDGNSFKTKVHIKPTNTGQCINYNSLAPHRYKTGVIKTLLHRSFKISSSSEIFETEINRLEQLFTNNNYPMDIIRKEIELFRSKTLKSTAVPPEPIETIRLFYHNQMNCQYKQEEINLKHIIFKNVAPIENHDLKLLIYYKNSKIRNLFIRNSPKKIIDHHIVYQYKCPKGECQPPATYIGYTTTTLKQRMTTHSQTGSIASHNQEKHKIKIRTNNILENTTVLFHSPEKSDLLIAEALLIKQKSPIINNQKEGETRILKIF